MAEPMNRAPIVFVIILSFILPTAYPVHSATTWEVCFTPGGNCTESVVKALSEAKTSVYVQAYSFTSAPIAKAPLEAHKRGVHVEIILDKSNLSAKYSSADFVAHTDIPTYIDSAHAIAHNKIMIIDSETVITGSFNFTTAA